MLPQKTRPLDVPPGGSLGLLAFGYRGIEAWRAARGTAWIGELAKRKEAERAARTASTDPNAPSAPDSL